MFCPPFRIQVRNVPKNKLQLVGVTALYIASKIEELWPPRAQEFAVTTDGAFSDQDIQQMEARMLQVCYFSGFLSI
jgi:cyclin E